MCWKMNRTPRAHGFYSRSGRQRGLTADEVADMAAYESYQSGFQRRKEGYGPNESLLSGEYRGLTDDELEDYTSNESLLTPLNGSSRYNSVRGNRHYDGAGHSGGELNLTAMLQEQQHILYQVLDTQKKMQKKQEFEMKLSELAQRSETSSSSSSPDSQRKKCRITRELTRKVAAVHGNLDEGYRLNKSSASTFNAGIKRKIVSEICSAPNFTYSEDEVKAAAQRKYESLRRQWKAEEKEDFMEKTRRTSLLKRYRSRRKRKFDNRATVVRESEMQYWNDLSIDFMSEESDDPDDSNCLIIHKLPWVSESLVKFMEKLDTRYEEKVKKDGVLVARKTRKIGSPAKSGPPPSAPSWTIDSKWNDISSSGEGM